MEITTKNFIETFFNSADGVIFHQIASAMRSIHNKKLLMRDLTDMAKEDEDSLLDERLAKLNADIEKETKAIQEAVAQIPKVDLSADAERDYRREYHPYEPQSWVEELL